jgi:sigma-B regulation protein RsbU (phosphoserine phosphatase)
MRRQAYNTNDPELLLRLKRQEADALRDVLRSINQAHLRPEHIFKVARNTLLAQCEVHKMKFVYRNDEGFHTGMRHGFSQITPGALSELPSDLDAMEVNALHHPSLYAMGVEYVVPVNYRNQVAAWLLVAEFAESEAERDNDLIFIEIIGNVVSAALENRNLIEDIVAQESLRRELEVAGRIQRQLLPTEFGVVESAKVYAENHAHHHIGGDFYDVISRGEKGFFICIADVAGKGIGAALLMANLQANLRALILSETDLESVVTKLHRILFNITHGDQFVTFFIAHVRPPERALDYINCGHNAPLLLRDGRMQELDVGTIPLGTAIPDLPGLREATVMYDEGDTLFMYTDGLNEQHNRADEMLGEHRIHVKLAELGQSTVQEIVAGMRAMYDDFCQGAEQEDDVTLLAVRF